MIRDSCDAILDIDERDLMRNVLVSLFPNPVWNDVTIHFDGLTNNAKQIFIYNLNGQKLFEFFDSGRDEKIILSMDNFVEGIYFVKILSDGVEIFSGKVLKL